MAQEHTPGPWSLETVRTSSGLCHKVGPFPWKAGKENHACIYDDYPAQGSKGTPELVANARLIAASPELLAAAELALEGIEVLDLLIASIEKHGNYSVESTLGFLNQARCAKLRLTEAVALSEGK